MAPEACLRYSNSEQNEFFERISKAGEVVQALFYMFIQNTWVHDMTSVRTVRDQHGALNIVEVFADPGVQAELGDESTCELYAGGWLVKFPNVVFTDEDKEAKQAVIADQNSLSAFVFMHAAVQVLFEDFVHDPSNDIREVVHYIPNNAQRLVEHRRHRGFNHIDRNDQLYLDHDSRGSLKGIYSISLKNGIKVALDVAGAQYHLPHQSIVPMHRYLNRGVSAIKYSVPFRSHYLKHANKMRDYRCITNLTIIVELTALFNNLITCSKKKLSSKLKNIADIELEAFDDALAQFIIQTEGSLQERIDDLDNGFPPKRFTKAFNLRHPNFAAKLPKHTLSVNDDKISDVPLFDISDMKAFDWAKLRKLLLMTGDDVKFSEKKNVKKLLSHCCVQKVPGDWRLVLLSNVLPSTEVPAKSVSKNPIF